jgi:spore maturation protein CgeB
MNIVFIGLAITSSWGNGHATTYRGLVRELAARGHKILFLERNLEWYASNRDMPHPSFCRVGLYESVRELQDRFGSAVREADIVVVGSFVPDGIVVGEWVTRSARGVTAFYDIDTPITLAKLAGDNAEYISRALIPRFDLYLSFTGGPTLETLERRYGSPCARPLYCSFDPDLYFPEPQTLEWDLGYMGTYSEDRQPTLERLLLEPARRAPNLRMIVAGPMFPATLVWAPNVQRIIHLSPREHRAFYNAQRFTLNITRAEMIRAGYSPSVRLFEAAACATPIISDYWRGLESFFKLDEEILIANSPDDTLCYLNEMKDAERRRIAQRARARVLEEHTAACRAAQFESYVLPRLARPVPAPQPGHTATVVKQ